MCTHTHTQICFGGTHANSCTDTLTHSTSPVGAQPLTGSVTLCMHLAKSYQPLSQVDGWLDSLRQTTFMGVFKAKTKTKGKQQTEASSSQNCLFILLLCYDSQAHTSFAVINFLLNIEQSPCREKSIGSIFSVTANSMITNSGQTAIQTDRQTDRQTYKQT